MDKEIVVVVSGLTNPAIRLNDVYGIIPVKVCQSEERLPQSCYGQRVSVDEDLGVDLDKDNARAKDVTMTFSFTPAFSLDSDDAKITITLNGFDTSEASLSAEQTQAGDVETVAEDVSATDDVFTLSMRSLPDDAEDDADAPANIMVGSGTVDVTIEGLTNPSSIGDIDNAVTVSQAPYADVMANISLVGTELSSNVAGDTVRIKISTIAGSEIPPGDDITVDLKSFVLPESIAREQVIIDGGDEIGGGADAGGTTPYYGNPAAVSISGSKVVLSIPIRDADGSRISDGILADSVYVITFKLGAGIKNPTVKQGDRAPSAAGEGDPADTTEVRSKVTAKNAENPKRGANASRGDRVTFSVVGLKGGSATIYLLQGQCPDDFCVDENGDPMLDDDGDEIVEDDDFRIGGGLQDGGKVEVERRVTSSLFEANERRMDEDGDYYFEGPRELVNKVLVGTNIIYSVDGTGTISDIDGRLAIEPTVDLGTDSIKQGGLLELEVEDWYYGNIYSIEVGGVPVTKSWKAGKAVDWREEGTSGGEAEFIVVMPPGVRLGEQQLKLTGTETEEQGAAGVMDVYTTTIEVDPLDLEITPVNDEGVPEVVINQEFTITGRGFNTNSGACILSVKFGDIDLEETTAGVEIDGNCGTGSGVSSAALKPDTAGNFSGTFKLEPGAAEGLKIGEYRVEVKDNEERVGLVDVLIPEPVVVVTPDTSRRGSTVTVVGNKFPASSELAVEIRYGLAGNERTITAATPDSTGNWRETFVIPTTAVIGEDHVIRAAPINPQFSNFEGKGLHRLPEQELIVSPSRVAAGGRMNLEGHNMPLFTLVRVNISGIGVSGEGFETDGIGSFVRNNILVPQLQPGIHTVTARVQTQGNQDVEVRTTVEVADIVTRPTEEVFADLITANQLTVVWKYDNASGMWASYDPAAPAELNDLDEVSTGDIVWIQITENVEFQGTRACSPAGS